MSKSYQSRKIRRAREQSKKRGGTWVVEEVVGGYRKGAIQDAELINGKGSNWWPSSVVKIIATYKDGVRQ